MAFERTEPYNDLPLLPPDTDFESKAILRQAVASARALANLKGSAARIPNQSILVNGIILQEARLSSEIENIVTTSDELYRAAASPDEAADPHTKECCVIERLFGMASSGSRNEGSAPTSA